MQNDQVINIILIAVSLLLVMGLVLVAFFYFSRRKFVSAELKNTQLELEHQKEMLQATILTQERERKRIAQDLHDAISSKLNIVSLNANVLIEGDTSQQETQEMLGTILKISDTTLENSRRIAHALLPPVLEKFGLMAAIEELTNDFNRAHSDLIQLDGFYEECLKKKDELHVFRIVQELVNNSLRHGKATNIKLTMGCHPFSMHYSDNGCGVDLTNGQYHAGLGMKNLQSRCDLIKRDLEVNSSPGNGFEVKITS